MHTLPTELQISGVAAGLHLTVTFPAELTELDVQRAAADRNPALCRVRHCYHSPNAPQGLVIGFCRATATPFTNALSLLHRTFQPPLAEAYPLDLPRAASDRCRSY
ncbi:MAG: hypothetical protein AB7O92_22340 [Acidimicrobiia bacterium]